MDLPILYSQTHPQVRKEAREQYIVEQGGKCCHCQEPLDGEPSAEVRSKWVNWRLFPRGFRQHPVHLHHDHSTDGPYTCISTPCSGSTTGSDTSSLTWDTLPMYDLLLNI